MSVKPGVEIGPDRTVDDAGAAALLASEHRTNTPGEATMFESAETQRRIGRFAWVMAWVGLVVGQLHALARHNTADGKEDLRLRR